MRIFICLFFTFVFVNPALAVHNLKSGDIHVADFESVFNYFGGTIGTFGAQNGSGITSKYAHSGASSFKLIFQKNVREAESEHFTNYRPKRTSTRSMKTMTTPILITNIDWAVLVLYMGPIVDTSVEPFKIKPEDLSSYKYLVFWVRGEKGGEDFCVYFRDASATSYEPQVKVKPHIVVQKRWKPVKIELQKIKGKIDLKNIVQINIGFGREDGNRPGNIMYIDDFILVK